LKISDTEYRIRHQQKVADDVLNRLEVIDPACIVAGGAPRDWYMGEVAKDIDVFLHLRNDLKASTQRGQIKRALGLEELDYGKSGENIPEHYALNPHLQNVWDLEIDGEKVQIMLMTLPTYESVVPLFPFNICKVWYKGGTIRPEPIFRYGVKNKVLIKMNELYGPEHSYLNKIREKFKDYSYIKSEEAFNKRIVDRVLRQSTQEPEGFK